MEEAGDERGRRVSEGARVVVARTITGMVTLGDLSFYTGRLIDPRRRRDRDRMLAQVRRTWIDGLLDDSLHGAALQALGLEELRSATPARWALHLLQPDVPTRTLASDTSLTLNSTLDSIKAALRTDLLGKVGELVEYEKKRQWTQDSLFRGGQQRIELGAPTVNVTMNVAATGETDYDNKWSRKLGHGNRAVDVRDGTNAATQRNMLDTPMVRVF